jgi:hypothetical protein
MKTEELKKQNNIDIEAFYQLLEDDPSLQKDAFERMLKMVDRDSKAAKTLARLIIENYQDLYEEIAVLSKPKNKQGNAPSCCGGN